MIPLSRSKSAAAVLWVGVTRRSTKRGLDVEGLDVPRTSFWERISHSDLFVENGPSLVRFEISFFDIRYLVCRPRYVINQKRIIAGHESNIFQTLGSPNSYFQINIE